MPDSRSSALPSKMSRACHASTFQYGMADIVHWDSVGSATRRQPSLEDLLEEAEALLIMQQAALKSCRNLPKQPAASISTVANTLHHLRTHLGRIRMMFAGG